MSFLQNKYSARLSTVKQVVSPLLMVWLVTACSSDGSAVPADNTQSAGGEQIVVDTLINDSSDSQTSNEQPNTQLETESDSDSDSQSANEQTGTDTTPDADQDIADTTPDVDQDIDENKPDTSIDSSNDEGSEQAGDSTATDSETAEIEQATIDDTGSDSVETGTIPGLWIVTRGTDIQYYEARANGNVSVWDYRGDSFQNGQDCYVKSVAFFRIGGGMTIEVFGEDIFVSVETNGRQVTFSDSEGPIDIPRADDLVTTDFTICGGDSNNFGAIPGLWDITVGDDVQYFEALADGNVSIWDYRADPFQNGQDCYVRSEAFFRIGGALTTEVFGEGIAVNVDTAGGQVGFTDIDGEVDFPRVLGIRSREFNLCGEG